MYFDHDKDVSAEVGHDGDDVFIEIEGLSWSSMTL